MANYADLMWQVRAELPGVPAPLLFFAYAEATREFFLQSLAWQYSCPNALAVTEGEAWPTLTAGTDIPSDTYVVQPVSVKWKNGDHILFKTRDQLDDEDGDWEQASQALPHYWTITSPGAWRLVPLPAEDVASAIYLRVALAPVVTQASSATSIPDQLAYEFQHIWAHGALSKLMKIPGKDWTDVRLAAAYGDMFEAGIIKAKSRAAADFGRPHRTVAYGGIGATGRRRDDYGA